MRWSNFLIWQAAYAELVVTEASWPEFDERQLFEAVLTYQKRTRKFGAVVNPPSA
jgi:undecaprenyl diphosphate synthase